MKHLHFTEHFVLYELPFAKGLQYNAALVSSEGGNFFYIATPEEIEENSNQLENILNQETYDFDSFDYE